MLGLLEGDRNAFFRFVVLLVAGVAVWMGGLTCFRRQHLRRSHGDSGLGVEEAKG